MNGAARWAERHWLSAFAMVLGAVLAVKYGAVAIGARTFFLGDYGYFGYPLARYHRDCFWSGQVALWNPYNCHGLPFLAQWNTLVLYPGSLIYLLLPLPWGLNLFLLAHLLWGGIGMARLAAAWSASRTGGCLAGLAYALSGLVQHSLMWPNNMAGLAWLPWVLLGVDRAASRGGAWLLWAAILGAMQMLSGAPEIILMTWLAAGLLAVAGRSGGLKDLGRRLVRLLISAAGVTLAAAVQLVPFGVLMTGSTRLGQGPASEQWPLPLNGWLNFLVPLANTSGDGSGPYWQPGQEWASSYYVGVITLLLVSMGWRRGWTRRGLVLAVLAVAGVVLAWGSAGRVLPWLQAVCFPLRVMNFPIKLIVLTVTVIPLLAALGWARLVQEEWNVRAFVWRAALLIGAMVVGLSLTRAEVPTGSVPGNGWASAGTRALVLGVWLAGWVWMTGQSRGRLATGLAGFAVVVMAADLATFAPRLAPTAPSWLMAPFLRTSGKIEPSPTVGEGRVRPGDDAVVRILYRDQPDRRDDYLQKRTALLMNLPLIDRIPSVYGFFSLYPARGFELNGLLAGRSGAVADPILDFLSVSQVTEPGSYRWVPRNTALPWLTAGQRPVFGEDTNVLEQLLDGSFRPAEVVFLPVDAESVAGVAAPGAVRVTDVLWGDQAVRATVESSNPTWLTVSQGYDPGWKAWVDGQAERVWRANYAFQAVWVPAGRHTVELRYRDEPFAWALLLSSGVAAGFAGAGVRLGGRDGTRRGTSLVGGCGQLGGGLAPGGGGRHDAANLNPRCFPKP